MVKAIKKRVSRSQEAQTDQTDQPITLEHLQFLSASARRALQALTSSMTNSEHSPDEQDAQLDDAFELLKRDLEGQAIEHLEQSLDWLREVGIYPLSLALLEEAWNAELPLDLLGRVAQDWVGTVLFGMSDEDGARVVARHLIPRALELGASFCSDLCDVLLEWGLYEEATPLAQFVVQAQPGDTSARFHLGVCAKLVGNWPLAQENFAEVHRLHPQDPATLWNQGIVAVAQKQWNQARQAWQALGFTLPKGEGDYASAGELSPIRLSCLGQNGDSISQRAQTSLSLAPKVRTEVLWGIRIGPARVQLTGIPYHHPTYRCGDIVLIDGVKAGDLEHQGQSFPISPVIGLFEKGEGETIDLIGPARSAQDENRLNQVVQELSAQGWTLALWTRRFPRFLETGVLTQLSIYLPPQRSALQLREILIAQGVYQAVCEEHSHVLNLYHPRWAEWVGESIELHSQARANLIKH